MTENPVQGASPENREPAKPARALRGSRTPRTRSRRTLRTGTRPCGWTGADDGTPRPVYPQRQPSYGEQPRRTGARSSTAPPASTVHRRTSPQYGHAQHGQPYAQQTVTQSRPGPYGQPQNGPSSRPQQHGGSAPPVDDPPTPPSARRPSAFPRWWPASWPPAWSVAASSPAATPAGRPAPTRPWQQQHQQPGRPGDREQQGRRQRHHRRRGEGAPRAS